MQNVFYSLKNNSGIRGLMCVNISLIFFQKFYYQFLVPRDYFFNGGLERSLIRQMKIEKTKFEKENKDGRYVLLKKI